MCAFLKPELLDSILAANLQAPVLLQAELLRACKINKNASIVFMASVAGVRSSPGNALYAASKGGLMAYARG